MKDFAKSVGAQFVAILLAALAAAAFAFIQSIATATGACPTVPLDPTETGAIGGVIKAGHSVFTMMKGKFLT